MTFNVLRIYIGCTYQYSLSRQFTLPSFETLAKVNNEAFSGVLIKPSILHQFLCRDSGLPTSGNSTVELGQYGKEAGPASQGRELPCLGALQHSGDQGFSSSYATVWSGRTHLSSLHCKLFVLKTEITKSTDSLKIMRGCAQNMGIQAGIVCAHSRALFPGNSWISPLPFFCFRLSFQGQEQEKPLQKLGRNWVLKMYRISENGVKKRSSATMEGAQRKESQAEEACIWWSRTWIGVEAWWCWVFGMGTWWGSTFARMDEWGHQELGRGAHAWHRQWPRVCVCLCLPSRFSLLQHF